MADNPSNITTPFINTIIGYYSNRENDPENVFSQSRSTLFHYTTADGLKGIIEHHKLWATSAYYLNDSSEVLHGYRIVNEVLTDWISRCGLSDSSLALGLANDLSQGFGHDLLNQNIIYPIYLACFCEDGDLLSQWRSYGQSGGYCLGFTASPEGPVLGMKPENSALTARWLKVEYDRNRQMQRCQELIDTLLPMLDRDELSSAIRQIDHQSSRGYQGILSAMFEILTEEALAYKNHAFEVEREWRIVVRSRGMLKPESSDGEHTPAPVYFRPARGLLTPYIKLVPSSSDALRFKYGEGCLPIASVCTGPTRDHTTSDMAVRMLLDQKGYRSTRVCGSGTPLRF